MKILKTKNCVPFEVQYDSSMGLPMIMCFMGSLVEISKS